MKNKNLILCGKSGSGKSTLIDIIMIACGSFTDKAGNVIKNG